VGLQPDSATYWLGDLGQAVISKLTDVKKSGSIQESVAKWILSGTTIGNVYYLLTSCRSVWPVRLCHSYLPVASVTRPTGVRFLKLRDSPEVEMCLQRGGRVLSPSPFVNH